jgi:hypothetical protein
LGSINQYQVVCTAIGPVLAQDLDGRMRDALLCSRESPSESPAFYGCGALLELVIQYVKYLYSFKHTLSEIIYSVVR